MDPSHPSAYRVAVVGAGPSGLFAAQSLLAAPDVEVDVFDRLPSPFGLLRYGVAPDHTSVKTVAQALARVFDSDRVRFLGLVEFGRDVSRAELLAAYDAVVYAVGASEDLRLGIPAEDVEGSRSAREFVAWYSGHPDAPPQSLAGVHAMATIGVGNVALDIARLLLKDPASLRATDMPEAVLAELRTHQVRDVFVIGRRGPQHASFTTPELRELLALPGVQVLIEAAGLAGIDPEPLDRRARANLLALQEAAAHQVDEPRARLHLLFWRRPVAVVGDGQVRGLILERTALDPQGRTVGTGRTEQIDVQLVMRAIGYRAVPLPGVPFDEARGIIPNDEGRVLDGSDVRPREYVTGWIKRGPVGVIGTNKSDAAQTVRHLLDDLAQRPPLASRLPLHEAMAGRGLTPSSFADWRRIDEAEIARGQGQERDRAKIEAWHDLLALLRREG